MADPGKHLHDTPHHVSICHVTSYRRVMTIVVTLMVVCVFLLYALAQSTPLFTVGPTLLDSIHATRSNATNSSESITREKVKNIRLLCLVLTMEKDLKTKVKAVNSTWVTRCDRYFYVISSRQQHPDFLNIDIPDSRENLVYKIQKAYTLIYEKYINDFDFILKADDDSYGIVGNVKDLVSHYESTKPGYIGYHFNHFIPNGYMSGGAGYVISNSGQRHMIERGYKKGVCEVVKNSDDTENSEDVETGKCLQTVGVSILSSLDAEGRVTFHPYPLDRHLLGRLTGYIYSWAKNKVQTAIPDGPIVVPLGTNVYAKAYLESTDWTVIMRLNSCYTTPSGGGGSTVCYIIKDGCEVDVNTHFISQAAHETRFVFSMFELSANHGRLIIDCGAVYCDTSGDPASLAPCRQPCRPVG